MLCDTPAGTEKPAAGKPMNCRSLIQRYWGCGLMDAVRQAVIPGLHEAGITIRGVEDK